MPIVNLLFHRADSITELHVGGADDHEFSPHVLCDLSAVGLGLEGVSVRVPRGGLERNQLAAFIDHCRARGTHQAVSVDDFLARLGTELHHLLVLPNAPREAFLGAVVAYATGALGPRALPGTREHFGENLAHYLARHAVSGEGMATAVQPAGIKLWERFAALSARGFPLDVAVPEVPSPLSVAIRENNHLALEAMLTAGATPCVDLNGWHPIHEAAACGNRVALDLVLDLGGNVNLTGPNGESPLLLAARNGHLGTLGRLLAHPDVNINARRQDGATAAFLASKYGQVEALRRLAEAGANLELGLDANGETPLSLAAANGHLELVKLLLDQKVQLEPSPVASRGALQSAAASGHAPVVRCLLDRGAKIDGTGQSGETALLLAARRGALDVAILLLKRGAQPDLANSTGMTPLHVAAISGVENMVATLLENGASINAPSSVGLTPLHCAARWGSARVCQRLLDHGANLESVARLMLTPLHAAAAAGKTEIVEILLNRGARIEAQAAGGATALYIAAKRMQVAVVRALLSRGASAAVRVGHESDSPLSLAARNGALEVVRALLEYSDQIGVIELIRCYSLARERGHDEVVKLVSQVLRGRPAGPALGVE